MDLSHLSHFVTVRFVLRRVNDFLAEPEVLYYVTLGVH